MQAPLKVLFYDELKIFVYRIDHIKKASFSRELLIDIVKFVAILEMNFYLPINANIQFTMNDGEIRFSASNTLILKQMCDQKSLLLNSLAGLKTLLDLGDTSKQFLVDFIGRFETQTPSQALMRHYALISSLEKFGSFSYLYDACYLKIKVSGIKIAYSFISDPNIRTIYTKREFRLKEMKGDQYKEPPKGFEISLFYMVVFVRNLSIHFNELDADDKKYFKYNRLNILMHFDALVPGGDLLFFLLGIWEKYGGTPF